MEKIMRFFKEEEGLEMAEYALMASLVCIVLVVAIGVLTGAIDTALRAVANVINPPAVP